MVRAISLGGFGALFLLISPKLRDTVTGGIESVSEQMALYAPWSSVGGVAAVLMILVYSFYRGAQPR
jgi:hypothetical protein